MREKLTLILVALVAGIAGYRTGRRRGVREGMAYAYLSLWRDEEEERRKVEAMQERARRAVYHEMGHGLPD